MLQEHRFWFTLLHMMVALDQWHISNVASAEFACRRFLLIQGAIRVSPKSPSFAGLQSVLQHHARRRRRTPHVEASILKQHRLLLEEQAEKYKKHGNTNKGYGDE